MKMTLTIFIMFSLLSLSQASLDFCVADYNAPQTPAGYSCKSPNNVTVDDFVFHGLNTTGNTTNVFKSAVTFGTDEQYPGINGLGVAIARLDIDVGGVIPIHTHPRSSQLLLLIEGTLIAGFISTGNVVYIETLHKGDVIVFPQGLLHFQINVGDSKALAFVSFGNTNPGLQIFDLALFRSNISTSIITATTLLDDAIVKKLKGIFGGSGYTMQP